MRAVNLAQFPWMRNLADVGRLVQQIGSEKLFHRLKLVEEADSLLFKVIVDLFADMEAEEIPSEVDPNTVAFVDFLVEQSLREDQYRVEDLVRTLARLRDNSPTKHHHLACEMSLRLHRPELARILGLNDFD